MLSNTPATSFAQQTPLTYFHKISALVNQSRLIFLTAGVGLSVQQESRRCGHVTLISRAAHRALEAVFGGHSAARPAPGLLSADGPPLCVSGAGREEGLLGSRLSRRDQLLLLLSLHKVSGAEGPSQAQGESNTLFLSVHRRPAVSVE